MCSFEQRDSAQLMGMDFAILESIDSSKIAKQFTIKLFTPAW